MGLLKRLFHSRDDPPNNKPQNYKGDYVGIRQYFFGGTSAGKSVTPFSAMQITAVYACVRIIAETVASLPLHTYQYTDSGKEKA